MSRNPYQKRKFRMRISVLTIGVATAAAALLAAGCSSSTKSAEPVFGVNLSGLLAMV